MGVPGLFPWFRNLFSKRIKSLAKIRPLAQAREEGIRNSSKHASVQVLSKNNSWDCLHIDLNGYIHVSAAKEIADAGDNPDLNKIFRAVAVSIEKLVETVRPKKLVNLCMDGVAPFAKMNQQRSRRYKSFAEKLRNKKLELSVDKKTVKDEDITLGFDTNVISPGTEFMYLLSQYLKKRYAIQSTEAKTNTIFPDLAIMLSDSQVPGEGEHKILKFLRSQPSSLSHLVVGDDADMLLLGLACRRSAPNFNILRSSRRGPSTKASHYEVVDIPGIASDLGQFLAEMISRDARPSYSKVDKKGRNISSKSGSLKMKSKDSKSLKDSSSAELDHDRLVDDFVYLCSFVGNDFLPPLPGCAIFDGGLDIVLDCYLRILSKSVHSSKVEYLTNSEALRSSDKDKSIVNGGKVKEMLIELASVERYVLERKFLIQKDSAAIDASLRKGRKGGGDKEKIRIAAAAKEAKEIGDNTIECSAGVAFVESKKAWEKLTREADSKGKKMVTLDAFRERWSWRWQYYLLKVAQFEDPEAITGMGAAYAEGLAFVYAYYFVGVPAWQWHYPYHYPPFAQEVSSASSAAFDPLWVTDSQERRQSRGRQMIPLHQPAQPFTQLLAIFPPESSHAIPSSLRHVMIPQDEKLSLRDGKGRLVYPKTKALKKLTDVMGDPSRSWVWVVRLPFVPLQKLSECVDAAVKNFTKEEQHRNTLFHDKPLIRIPVPPAPDKYRSYIFPSLVTASFVSMLYGLRGSNLRLRGLAAFSSLCVGTYFIYEKWSRIGPLPYLLGKLSPSEDTSKSFFSFSKTDSKFSWSFFQYKLTPPLSKGITKTPKRVGRRKGFGGNKLLSLGVYKRIASQRQSPVEEQVKDQLEYWFKESNYSKDSFLEGLQLDEDEVKELKIVDGNVGGAKDPADDTENCGWIPLKIIIGFKRMRVLFGDIRRPLLKKILFKATENSKVVIMSKCGNYIRRRFRLESTAMFPSVD